VSLDPASVRSNWHLIPSNGLSRVHECDSRQTTDRQTDHATEKCVARAIPPKNVTVTRMRFCFRQFCELEFRFSSACRHGNPFKASKKPIDNLSYNVERVYANESCGVHCRQPDVVHAKLQPAHVGEHGRLCARHRTVDARDRSTLLLHVRDERLQRFRLAASLTQLAAAPAQVVAMVIAMTSLHFARTRACCCCKRCVQSSDSPVLTHSTGAVAYEITYLLWCCGRK